MAESGLVVAVRDGVVDVAMEPGEACSKCGACSASGNRMVLSDVPTSMPLAVGDRVEVDVPEAARTRARVLVFVVPVIVLVIGYLAGFLLGSRLGISADSAGAGLALACGAAALGALPLIGRKDRGAGDAQVQVRAIISQASRPVGGDRMRDGLETPDEEDETRE